MDGWWISLRPWTAGLRGYGGRQSHPTPSRIVGPNVFPPPPLPPNHYGTTGEGSYREPGHPYSRPAGLIMWGGARPTVRPLGVKSHSILKLQGAEPSRNLKECALGDLGRRCCLSWDCRAVRERGFRSSILGLRDYDGMGAAKSTLVLVMLGPWGIVLPIHMIIVLCFTCIM